MCVKRTSTSPWELSDVQPSSRPAHVRVFLWVISFSHPFVPVFNQLHKSAWIIRQNDRWKIIEINHWNWQVVAKCGRENCGIVENIVRGDVCLVEFTTESIPSIGNRDGHLLDQGPVGGARNWLPLSTSLSNGRYCHFVSASISYAAYSCFYLRHSFVIRGSTILVARQ